MASTISGVPGDQVVRPKSAVPWAPIAWFTALLILCYIPVIIPMVRQWNADEDMGHGFFVPVVAGYIAWKKREEVLSLPLAPSLFGLVLLLWGLAQSYLGALACELFLQRSALIISLLGAVLLLAGRHVLQALALPLFLLLFMIPLPAIIYNQITFPLQLFASRVAEFLLGAVGIPVLREGNILELASQKLSVVEACSGIRSLLSLGFLSLVYAYFFDKRSWMLPVLLISTVPIAIAANAARVTFTGIISEYNPELAKGFFHSAEGWIIFMVALCCLVLTHQVISRIAARWGRS